MTKETILNELRKRGIPAETTEVTKNGISFQTIVIGDGDIRPNVYVDRYADLDDSKIDSVIEEIMELISSPIHFNKKELTNWEWAKSKAMLCIQKQTDEDICKRAFLDLEMYIRIMDNENHFSYKVTPSMLNMYNIDENTLFDIATENTSQSVLIEDMAYVIAEMLGITVEEAKEAQGDLMLIATNKSKCYGASAICYKDLLQDISNKMESDLIILPSSVHECIIIPTDESTDCSYLNSMVNTINKTEVLPEEVLSNHVYKYWRDENKITFYHDTKSGSY